MNLKFWNKKATTDSIDKRIKNARNNMSADTTIKRKNILSNRIVPENIPKANVAMDRLKMAVDLTKSIESPDRIMLYSIYEQIKKDTHLLSQLRTANNTVIQRQFIVIDKSKNENSEALEYFEKSWFSDYLSYAIDSEFWGHSLIELADFEDGEFKTANLLNRYNVIPELGKIKLRSSDDISKAIDYRSRLSLFNLIEIGETHDLGLFEVASREVIWKSYSRADWSQASEKFGMPMLVIRTDTSNDTELDKIEQYAQNFGSNSYTILNKEDEVEIASFSGGNNFYEIYDKHIKVCDAYLSKLVNGQTMTSDDGSSYSQANVHERILNDYTLARMQRLQRDINDKLIPFLIENGYKLEGLKFQFLDLIPKEEEELEGTLSVKKKGLSMI